MDAFAVAEFLACFGTQCGAPALDLMQLQAAVAWPLDGPELSNIYIALVKYLLAQWVSQQQQQLWWLICAGRAVLGGPETGQTAAELMCWGGRARRDLLPCLC
jgi:hypothetical protein